MNEHILKQYTMICVRHGHEYRKSLTEDDLRAQFKCEECGQPAVPKTLARLAFVVPDLIREIAKLRMDILDLQCGEDGDAQ